MKRKESSLSEINGIIGNLCDGAFLAYHLAANQRSRVDALERILDSIYNKLVENRKLNRSHSEDALTVSIVSNLQMLDIDANHGIRNYGHCDIMVRARDQFTWVAEAKIHNGYGWLEKGVKQLSSYLTGLPSQDYGEIIIYLRQQHATDILREWMQRLQANWQDLSVEDRVDSRMYFKSHHKSQNTGRNLCIRHRVVPLYCETA